MTYEEIFDLLVGVRGVITMQRTFDFEDGPMLYELCVMYYKRYLQFTDKIYLKESKELKVNIYIYIYISHELNID